jgi:hypothetical protein
LPTIIFGNTETFAIEATSIHYYDGYDDAYMYFRFWIQSIPLGDWDYSISGISSPKMADSFVRTAPLRRQRVFSGFPATSVFKVVYDAFFETDWLELEADEFLRSLRDVYHISLIGEDATIDCCAVVLVAENELQDRVIARDLRKQMIVAEAKLPVGAAEEVFRSYATWVRNAVATTPKPPPSSSTT